MLGWYHWVLIVTAVLTVAVSWNVPRVKWWVVLGAVSFIVSAWWWRQGLPYGAALGAVTNAVIVLSIHTWGREKGEMFVAWCFLAMILLDGLVLTGAIQPDIIFSGTQEVLNFVAMLALLVMGIRERARNRGLDFSRSGPPGVRHVYRLGAYLSKRRKSPPSWQE